MNRPLAFVLLVVCGALLEPVSAGDFGNFKTAIIASGDSPFTLHVGDDHFVRIRNFTQQGSGTTRGVVSVASGSGTDNVLSATQVDENAAGPPEPITGVVVPGPADITVMPVTGATLVVTYIKQSEVKPTPTATPTVSATATASPTATATP